MIVGACMLEFHLPACRSLKQKRMFLNRLKGRVSSRFNVAIAEVDHHDLWQRSTVAVVSVSTEQAHLDALFEKVVREAERAGDGELLRYEVEYL